MKNYQYLFFISIFVCTLGFTSFSQHSINGDIEVCFSDCSTYSLVGGAGGPYYWKSTGEIQETNQGSEIEICWNTIGSNTVTLVDFSAPISSQTEVINVEVASIPTPDIIFPKYPECGRKDSLPGNPETDYEFVECFTACSSSIGFYGFKENDGATVEWEMGGGTILEETLEGITIEWNPSGTGFIKLIETNSQGCTDSVYYCIDILEPLDVDILAFNGGANDITVCAEQEVYLQAIGSQEATDFEWHMGDGTFQYGTNVTTSYSQGGTYDIMLIGASECKCFDTSYYQIIVDSNPGPQITCIGTTCGNEEHTYYASNTCATYNWNISGNGSIVDGGGNADDFITINWNSGPVGTIGLTASGCDDAVCPSETVVQIPILDGSASIEGPTEVCKEGHSTYSVQYYNGTSYQWSLTGNGSIISGGGTNEITVQWDDAPWSDNTSFLTVSYENCYLECGGQADITIDLKTPFNITVPPTVCTDRVVYLQALDGWNNATVEWSITSPSGITTNYPSNSSISETFTELGVYAVVATDNTNTYCNAIATGFFEVVERPLAPTFIEGPMVICLNEFYNYTVPPPAPGVLVQWNIFDGSNYTYTTSNSVSVQWTSNGPYSIRVRYILESTSCQSEFFEVDLETAQNATISGSSTACQDEIETYSIGAANGTLPEWSIIPPNAGSIIHNPDQTIDVMWHIPGNHQIETDYCGASILYNVEVAPLGVNDIVFDEEVCPGDFGVITSMIPSSSTVEVKDENGLIIGTTPTLTVPPGKYDVEVTSDAGCVEIIPVEIDTFLPPSIRLSSPDVNAFCLPHPEVSIVALNTNDGYTYEWFYNNAPLGNTASSITTNQFGGYQVQVTDNNGCTALSNVHRLYEWCMGDPPPGTCTGGGGILDPQNIYLRCNNLQFSIGGNAVTSTSFTWNFDDPGSGINNTSNEVSPIHEFSTAGYFYVSAIGDQNGEQGVNIFTVPAAPRFDYEDACAGNPVQFRNHSTFIPGFTITNYVWNFGDPSSGSDNMSNDENPMHTFDNPGIYTVTLDIESDNGCLSTYQVEVVVEGGPLAQFIVPVSACSEDGLFFEAIQDDEIYSYVWDFDDPSSGASNSSTGPLAIHTFGSSGSYDVRLSVTDRNDCIQSITKTINVTTTSLNGDINTDQTFPMCYGEEVNLTAPSGGTAYLWSNGNTTQTITVSDPGIYYVTVSESLGCDYVPDPINVIVEGILENKIRGSFLSSSFSGPYYFDSIEICQGELFTLSTNWISGASYEWSTSQTTSYLNEYQLNGLAPGSHDFYVTITDPNSGCEIESAPYKVIVHELPPSIQISTPSPTPCEGEVHVLTVDNPDPELLYYWSNGDTGHSTEVNKGGYYSITAINKFGCEGGDNGIYISPRPNANKINIGCVEACFPDTICTPFISGTIGYQWLFNGAPMPGANGLNQDLIADQAGDYQLIVTSYAGCMDTSEILSIDAIPSDQSVSGLVFIDENNNGVWDAGEELLAGVPVNLYMGNTFIVTVLTDNAGYYIFDPVDISDPHIEIDTTGLGLSLTGGIFEEDIFFIGCNEDKEQDFPLIKECSPDVENVELFTCVGETIIVNNIVLQEGDTWTFDDLNQSGCDSTTSVVVIAYPEADVNLTVESACPSSTNGTLDIAIMTGTGLQFAVDNPSSFTTNLQFNGLAPGTHTLWLTDENGCMKSVAFEVGVVQTPEMNIVVQNSCINGNTGSVEIIPTVAGNYLYSIDGIEFNYDSEFYNMPPGAYTIIVNYDNMCTFEYPFVISTNPDPEFNLMITASCSTGATGGLEITPISGGSYSYSLDNINFTTSTLFDNLPSGSSTLFVQELNGCSHEYPFLVPISPDPEFDIATENTCEGESQGNISITPVTSGNYQYSLDGITYSSDVVFSNLGQGMHTIYVLEEGECEFQFTTEIGIQPEPFVTLIPEDACLGESNGSIHIETSDSNLEYSLDNVQFSTQEEIENLLEGDYTIYVKGPNGCITPFDVTINVGGELIVEFEEPILDCSIEEIDLTTAVQEYEGELSYSWNDGSTDSTLTVRNSGAYALTVSDKCSSLEYNWDIQMEEVNAEQPLYLPNIFSPNQDGINECFVPTLSPETTIISYKLIIFDRWGNKYFETTDLEDCWDGTYNGTRVRSGVFVYVLEMDYTYCVEVETFTKYGDVTVIH
ncbi:MAG: PKD domain-containing protein [Saprospiraceae bacterium]|nr:PKD domain-containing protein [Saprospiraceae bacterium]